MKATFTPKLDKPINQRSKNRNLEKTENRNMKELKAKHNLAFCKLLIMGFVSFWTKQAVYLFRMELDRAGRHAPPQRYTECFCSPHSYSLTVNNGGQLRWATRCAIYRMKNLSLCSPSILYTFIGILRKRRTCLQRTSYQKLKERKNREGRAI